MYFDVLHIGKIQNHEKQIWMKINTKCEKAKILNYYVNFKHLIIVQSSTKID